MADLVSAFYRYFDIVSADDEALRDAAHRLRYQVYCVEHPYEDPRQFPDARERDSYDARAVQSVVIHRATGSIAATVRLVLPDPTDSRAPYPVEHHCAKSFQEAGFDASSLPRARLAEISRFAVASQFRRRPGEPRNPTGLAVFPDTSAAPGAEERRVLPHLTVGLFTAIMRMSATHGVTHLYAVMEPALLRLLARFGIYFQTIGGPVLYHGLRQPCFGVIDELLAAIFKHRRDVWELITDRGRTTATGVPDDRTRIARNVTQ